MTDVDVSGAVCEKCGGTVSVGEETQIICDGCQKSTAMCDCTGGTPTTYEPLDREIVGQQKRDDQ